MVGDGIDKIYKEMENINLLEMMVVLYQLSMKIIF